MGEGGGVDWGEEGGKEREGEAAHAREREEDERGGVVTMMVVVDNAGIMNGWAFGGFKGTEMN